MPIRHRIIPQFFLVVSVGHGVLGARDLQHHRSELLADPAYGPALSQLMDLRRVRDFTIQAREIRSHALAGAFDGPYFSRIAVIADSDLAFGLARLYEAHVGGHYGEERFTVFRDKALAWQWLTAQPAQRPAELPRDSGLGGGTFDPRRRYA